MMELGDMPYRSTIFRISRLWTFDLKRVIMILNSSKCASKMGLPKICVGDIFYVRGGPLMKKVVGCDFVTQWQSVHVMTAVDCQLVVATMFRWHRVGIRWYTAVGLRQQSINNQDHSTRM